MRRTISALVHGVLLLVALATGAQAAAKPAKSATKQAAKPAPTPLLDVRLFQLDSAHSSIEFAVQWMGLTKVRGTFTDIRGTIGFDANDLTRSSVTISIQMPSITTFNERRDKDIRGKSFFDVATYPTASFTSRSIEKAGDAWVMRGPLTIRDVTRDVEIPFTFLGEVVDSGGTGHRLGFEGHLAIQRMDYGVKGTDDLNKLTQVGQRMIGDQVDLAISLQGWMFTPDKLKGTEDSLYREIVAKGVPELAKNYRKLRAVTPDSLMALDEATMNSMGYQMLLKDRAQDALALFQLELEAYGETAYAHTGMGQAYAALGERDLAISNCEKALSLNPGATRATEILRRLKPAVGG
jgi:polyisoprenoid-binding protein YceI